MTHDGPPPAPAGNGAGGNGRTAVTFTLDLEGYGLRGGGTVPLGETLDALLEAAASADARGTVFVVGELARRWPDLVSRCVDAGHEIGLHGYRHVPIDQLGPSGFQTDVARGRAVLEDITGVPLAGYRAPLFSLTPATTWAPATLQEQGFTYSSSVLPAANPIRGFPGAPNRAFRWPCGLIELPCPVVGCGPARLPYLGGVYLRYLPSPLLARLTTHPVPGMTMWLYCHPYDADATGRRLSLPHAGGLTTWILSQRRRSTAARVTRVLRLAGAAPPLGERLPDPSSLPVFRPAA